VTPRVHRPSAQLRRDALLRAAVEIVAESGTGGATHRAIAARAGVPPATTSYFFASIDDLLTEATQRFTAEQAAAYEALAGELADAPPGDFAARFAAALMGADRIVELAQVEAYLHAARDPSLRSAAAEVMTAFERSTIAALQAVGVEEPARFARTFMAFVDGAILQHLANPRPDDEDHLRDGLEMLFTVARRPRAGARR
jgi:TetR/AcrR family transcriptional regulator, regulator of biofilm formation and stress response